MIPWLIFASLTAVYGAEDQCAIEGGSSNCFSFFAVEQLNQFTGDCCAECRARDWCIFYSHNNYHKICYLGENVNFPYANTNCVSGVKKFPTDETTCPALGISNVPTMGTPHSCYWIEETVGSWTKAMSACAAKDGHLAHFHTIDTSRALRAGILRNTGSYWTGCKVVDSQVKTMLSPDVSAELGCNVELSGENLGDCIMLNNKGEFYRLPCNESHSILCQKDTNKANYELVPGKGIVDGKSFASPSVTDRYNCGIECLRVPGCLAFSYNAESKACDLMKHKPNERPDDFNDNQTPTLTLHSRVL